MSPLQAIVLGLIQGVTEFLPISSSAHLVLTSFVLEWEDQGLAFDIAAHLGTLASLCFFFRHELAGLVRRPATPAAGDPAFADERHPSLLAILVLATLPVAVAGWLLQDLVAIGGRQPMAIAWVSIAFALLLGWADRRSLAPRHRSGSTGAAPPLDLAHLTWRSGLVVGLYQALALFPGVSRSGITLTAALLLGFGREPAARFSLLLAIPVGVLVAIKQIADLSRIGPDGAELWAMAVGFATAAVSSFVTIAWLIAWVRRQSLDVFVVYRVVLGLVIVFLILKR